MLVEVPVSVGELIDKVTILEIKFSEVKDLEKAKNIKKELKLLNKKLSEIDFSKSDYDMLKFINSSLWTIEDLIRKEEAAGRFLEDFIFYARMIYMYNDMRAVVKKRINSNTNSEIVEEKIY